MTRNDERGHRLWQRRDQPKHDDHEHVANSKVRRKAPTNQAWGRERPAARRRTVGTVARPLAARGRSSKIAKQIEAAAMLFLSRLDFTKLEFIIRRTELTFACIRIYN